ncbi:hypothetical protein FHS96_002433 [Sphingomonas zeicaulis]
MRASPRPFRPTRANRVRKATPIPTHPRTTIDPAAAP